MDRRLFQLTLVPNGAFHYANRCDNELNGLTNRQGLLCNDHVDDDEIDDVWWARLHCWLDAEWSNELRVDFLNIFLKKKFEIQVDTMRI